VKQPDSRSDFEQPIRVFVHVKREILCTRQEMHVHEAIIAPVTRPPSVGFITGTIINVNGGMYM